MTASSNNVREKEVVTSPTSPQKGEVASPQKGGDNSSSTSSSGMDIGSGFYLGCVLWTGMAYFYYTIYKQNDYMTLSEFSESVGWQCPAIMSLLYLALIFVGPKLVTKEITLGGKLKDIMISYNAFQVCLNSWWCIFVIRELILYSQPIIGANLRRGHDGYNLGFLMYVHYHNKFTEFCDSLFMVLRCKHQQLSFLHIEHHLMMVWAWYAPIKMWNGGDAWFGAWINSFIHVLMYGYYTLAAVKIPCPWKKMLTKMQMAQFCICFTHASLAMYVESTPAVLCCIQLFVMTNLFILFGHFYRKQYKGKQQQAAAAARVKAE